LRHEGRGASFPATRISLPGFTATTSRSKGWDRIKETFFSYKLQEVSFSQNFDSIQPIFSGGGVILTNARL
jgi:hypothetical protein